MQHVFLHLNNDQMKLTKLFFESGSWEDHNILLIESDKSGLKVSPISKINAEVPSDKDWQVFLKKLKDLQIHDWKGYYENSNILDGHQWSFEFVTDEISINTGGTNGYPGEDPRQTVFEYENSLFEELEYAIDKLIGRKSRERDF